MEHYKNNINKIIVIQRYFRSKPTASKNQTQKWRSSQKWYKNGKCNECEKYQVDLVQQLLNCNISKTKDRIKKDETLISNTQFPYKLESGFEYTENFDRKIKINDTTYYFNFKFVCGAGGAQTRTLKDVYDFITAQLEILLTYKNIVFINILDGDASYDNMNKFRYLLSKKQYNSVVSNIFVGDLLDFSKTYKDIFDKLSTNSSSDNK